MDPISLIFAIGVIGYVGWNIFSVVFYTIAELIPSRGTRLARARGRVLLLEAQAAIKTPEPIYNPESWYDSVLLSLSPDMRAVFDSSEEPPRLFHQITPLVKSAARRSTSSSSRQSL